MEPGTRGPLVVVSGAPGTGKSTVAEALAAALHLQLLSLDPLKEAIADVLGLGDEDWSNRTGDASAEIIFRLSGTTPGAVVEGWWRRERRERALAEFAGGVEVFCRCAPELAVERAQARLGSTRHLIHRDVINPSLLDQLAHIAATVEPLHLSGGLVVVDTTDGFDPDQLVPEVARLADIALT